MSRLITLFTILVVVLTSCGGDPGTSIGGASYIPVTAMSMPDSALIGSSVLINISSQAPDGCFYELQYDVTSPKTDTKRILAWGKFQDDGSCPSFKPAKDTTITFKSTSAGTFYFTANQAPYTVLLDSVVFH